MRKFALALVPLAALMLAACGGPSQAAAPPTAAATKAPTPVPTPTPKVPPTIDQVMALVKAVGIPIGATNVYTAANDPNKLLGRPNQYTAKANWVDTRITKAPRNPDSIDTQEGGSVEIFSNAQDEQARFTYVSNITKSAPIFAEYDTTIGDFVFLRLGHALTPDQAKQYQDALKSLG